MKLVAHFSSAPKLPSSGFENEMNNNCNLLTAEVDGDQLRLIEGDALGLADDEVDGDVLGRSDSNVGEMVGVLEHEIV